MNRTKKKYMHHMRTINFSKIQAELVLILLGYVSIYNISLIYILLLIFNFLLIDC